MTKRAIPEVQMHNELRVYLSYDSGGNEDAATLVFGDDKTVVDVDELLALRNYAAGATTRPAVGFAYHLCVEYKERGETCRWVDMTDEQRSSAEWDSQFWTVYGWREDSGTVAIVDCNTLTAAKRVCATLQRLVQALVQENN